MLVNQEFDFEGEGEEEGARGSFWSRIAGVGNFGCFGFRWTSFGWGFFVFEKSLFQTSLGCGFFLRRCLFGRSVLGHCFLIGGVFGVASFACTAFGWRFFGRRFLH